MIKHRFIVNGITPQGSSFSSTCISTDIIEAIQEYRKALFSPHVVVQSEQVHSDTKIGIENIIF